ncbi:MULTISPECIES: MbtH family NRPS accessory protein [Streptomyces]|uniref:MbtH protein n=1 Tax=Streptomyces misionensis TaxID=67331 RepID=A0A1H5FGK9_9ACTN|nr:MULTISPECIES: MbtH family NRPS accessory protein [Streptomyces]SEE02511.1 MbtH protein [Streptomyces misionensis]SFY49428.1 hypothetical protein STEPF1_02666 [Streptomyces sp. F-1]
MSGNPFDGGEGDWLVVANEAGQHALWRPYLELPKGWRIVHRGPRRDDALDYAEQNFTAPVDTPTA